MPKPTLTATAATLSTADVANLLGYSIPTIRKLAELEGDPIPSIRLPGRMTHRRFRLADVEAWAARHMTGRRTDG